MWALIWTIGFEVFTAIWTSIWTFIYQGLTNSAPSDGTIYNAKFWIVRHITEPILDAAWVCGIRGYKPISQYTSNDLI